MLAMGIIDDTAGACVGGLNHLLVSSPAAPTPGRTESIRKLSYQVTPAHWIAASLQLPWADTSMTWTLYQTKQPCFFPMQQQALQLFEFPHPSSLVTYIPSLACAESPYQPLKVMLTLCHILHSVSHWPVLEYFINH
jgi:hypothetical protein